MPTGALSGHPKPHCTQCYYAWHVACCPLLPTEQIWERSSSSSGQHWVLREVCCSVQVASTLSSTFYSMFFLFSGFLQPKSAIPPWWIWWAPCQPVLDPSATRVPTTALTCSMAPSGHCAASMWETWCLRDHPMPLGDGAYSSLPRWR